jgi:membrane fusion protein
VQQVSETALTAHELPVLQAQGVVGPLAAAEPVRRITVALEQPYVEAYGQRRALTPGTLLEADVVQDTRAIWEWLFEPLLAARQQMKVLSGDVGPVSNGG